MKKLIFSLSLCCFIVGATKAQDISHESLLWSNDQKLTVNDFAIKVQRNDGKTSYGQFTVNYNIKGFDLFARNFNKKVRNLFVRSASWIDTTADIQHALLYQQTLFDISEIYTRQLRKALRENRKSLGKGVGVVDEISRQIMADFSKRQLAYDLETASGTNRQKQEEWELQIKKELAELEGYAFER